MSVDAYNVNRAREVIKAKLLREIKTQLVDPVIDQHRNDGDCVKISYEGTAQPLKKESDVEFDIAGQKTFDLHGVDLENDDLFDGWADIVLAEKTIYDSSTEGCLPAPPDQSFPRTKKIPLSYPTDTVLFSGNKHPDDPTELDDAIAKRTSTVVFNVAIIVTVRKTKCFSALRIEQDRSDQAIASSLTTFSREVLPPFVASLIRNRPLVAAIAAEISTATKETGLGGSKALASGVASALKPKLEALFNDSSFNLFPPSLSSGKGEKEIVVSPTAGGSDSPGASASIGVQVDINPKGEGKSFIGRFTAGVDVDDSGKPVGASVGWKCRF